MKKGLFVVVGAGALSVVMASSLVGQEEAVRPAKVHVVEDVTATFSQRYPAIVLPSREVELSFRVGGQVVELPARAAAEVAENDVIARLDQRDFNAQVAQLESQRDQASAELDALRAGARAEERTALEANVASAEAQLGQAQAQLERTQQLASTGAATPQRLEQDETAVSVAVAALDAQREQLAIGLAGARPEEIAAAEAALRGINTQLQAAEDSLDDATLRAPFAGIIARRFTDNFTNIQPGETIVLLQSLNPVHLTFDLPAPDVVTFSSAGIEGVINRVVFDARPGEEFDAEIIEFSIQADAATQTYRGRVSVVPPEDAVILPGMNASVITSVPIDRPLLSIPLTAVNAASAGETFVWIVSDDNTVVRRDVTLGPVVGDTVSVLDGVESGETIVAAGVNKLIEGMAIRPIDQVGG